MGCNRTIVPFGVAFFIAVAVYIVGASLPYWWHHNISFVEAHQGLFLRCAKAHGQSVCVRHPAGYWELHAWAAVAGLVLSIIATILILVWTVGSRKSVGIAGKSLGICAGICGIVSVIYYGVLIVRDGGVIPNGFAYYITAAGATWLALQSAIGLCMRFPEPEHGNQGNNQQMIYVVQPGQQYVNPGVQPGQQYVNPGVQPGQQYVNPGVQPGQQYVNQGVPPGQQYVNPGVQPGQQYVNPGVQPGQQYVNPGVQPGQQYVNPGVQPGEQYVNPGVQPGQQYVNPGFAAPPADKAPNPPAYSPGY